MLRAFYTLIIYPLTQVIEFAFMLVFQVFKDSGVAVIGVSVAVSLLCLPLYIVAEGWSKVERKKVASMSRGVLRIKNTFKGDEQYMILSTFYKQNNYSPVMALRSSFGLLIQIPFFIAAYNFLSNCELLKGESFWFIKNLSTPDNIFSIGNFSVNILPIIMTAINIAASVIYTKGFTLREKLPIYIMAAIFLVILYTSPAGLVLYWTMNNVFSLVKNIFYKIKKPIRVLYILLVVVVILLDFYLLFVRQGLFNKRVLLAAVFSLTLFAPLVINLIRYMLGGVLKQLVDNKRTRHTLFFTSVMSLFLFFGLVIPSLTIKSSVVEFTGIDNFNSPLPFLLETVLQSIGIFLFWGLCVYALFGKNVQSVAAVLMAGFLLAAITNAFVFSSGYSTLTRVITFSSPIKSPTILQTLFNIALLFVCFALPIILLRFRQVLNTINVIILIGCLGVGVINIFEINKNTQSTKVIKPSIGNNDSPLNSLDNEEGNFNNFGNPNIKKSQNKAVYQLTKTGKNVILIMLDRAESAYLSSVFNDRPDIKKMYDGFVYYENCVSFNQGTLLAAPALFGGYEYTPLNINKRSSEKLVDKHNESLLLLPRIFTEQSNFSATVTDLSWANYSWTPDMSICDKYPAIKGSNIEGKFIDDWVKNHPGAVKTNLTSNLIKRNLLWFSLFRSSPNFLREAIYHEGTWWASTDETNDIMEFLGYYSTLCALNDITTTSDIGNQYICFVNDTSHSGANVKGLDPTLNTSLDYSNIGTFVAALYGVGSWLSYLRNSGCFDNTRIVIVSDHGMGSNDGEELTFGKFIKNKCKELGDYRGDHNHPLLLFKDFNKAGDCVTDDTFMTNADVPILLTQGIIDGARNPYTNKIISDCVTRDSFGNKCAIGVVITNNWSPDSNYQNTFKVPKSDWFNVSHNIIDYSNWMPAQ